MFFFFFFQAEDGIRDLTVTGVQTCALPISSPSSAGSGWRRVRRDPSRSCAIPRAISSGESVNIAILGGTGKEGSGLGARWALAGHSIILGSRDAERARTKAAELRERTRKLAIIGHTNAETAELGQVIVIALPALGLASTLPQVRESCRDKVVISTVVALS